MPNDAQPISLILAKYNNATTIGTALRRAAAGQGKAVELESDIKTLVAAADVINEKDNNPKFGRTALHQAVVNNNKSAVELLLQLGARYDIEDASGATVLCLSNINEEIQKLLLLKITTDKSKEVFNHYTAVETYAERSVALPLYDQLCHWMTENLAKGMTLASFLQTSLMMEATDNHRKESIPKEKMVLQDQAYDRLNKLFELFIQCNTLKTGIKLFPVKMNFCGLLCLHLAAELIKHKAFANNIISLTSVKVRMNSKQHEFILINGDINNIRPNTIICNIMRNEIFCGSKAKQYLNSDVAQHSSYSYSNQHPNFNHFTYGKSSQFQFLSQIKNICLNESLVSNYYAPLLEFFIKTIYEMKRAKPQLIEKTFELWRTNGNEPSVSQVKAMLRDYKPTMLSAAAGLTTFSPVTASTQDTNKKNDVGNQSQSIRNSLAMKSPSS